MTTESLVVMNSHKEAPLAQIPAKPAALLSIPMAARIYVAVVIGAGAVCTIAAATHLRMDQPWLFAALLALAVAASTAKIELPLGRGLSNLSLSHAVNFSALFA